MIRSSLLMMVVVGMVGCAKSKSSHQFEESDLRARCVQLNVTCEVQEKLGYNDFQWMAWAHTHAEWPKNSDYWFAWGSSRAEALDKLNDELRGNPTNPGDPLKQTIYEAPKAKP